MKKKVKYYFLITLIFVIVELLVNPTGEFPLNDDWAYSIAVKSMIEGNMTFSGWQAIPMISQICWGFLFVKLFGFSFTALRMSTLIIHLTGMFLIFSFLNRKTNEKTSFLLTLIIGLNPLCLELANTFMPDIPVMVFGFLTFYCLYLFYSNNNYRWYLLGILSLIIAVLIRQTALVVPAAFFIFSFLNLKKNKLSPFLYGLALIAGCCTLLIFEYLMKTCHITPNNYGFQSHVILHNITHPSIIVIQKAAYYLFNTYCGTGLLLFPVLILYTKRKILYNNKLILIFVISFVILTLKLIISKKIMPFTGNIFHQTGVGPHIMYDDVSYYNLFSTGESIIWILLSLTGLFSSSIIALKIFETTKNRSAESIVPLIIILGYTIILSFSYLSDRYLVFLFPFVAVLLINSITEYKVKHLIISIFIMISISVVTTHDYLSIHRTLWKLINELEKKGVTPDNIDAGFEYYGLKNYEHNNHILNKNINWWSSGKENFIITSKELKGFTITDSLKTNTWLDYRRKYLYIYKKE